MSTGIYIVIALKRRKAAGKPSTQRWLLDALHCNGFPTLTESMLSNILNGHYTSNLAEDVLKAADAILAEQSA